MCPLCPYTATCVLDFNIGRYIRDIHTPTHSSSNSHAAYYGCPREFSKSSTFKTDVYDLHGGDPLVANVKERSTTQQATAMEVEDVGEPETVPDDRQCEITSAVHTLYTIIHTQFQLHKRIAAQT